MGRHRHGGQSRRDSPYTPFEVFCTEQRVRVMNFLSTTRARARAAIYEHEFSDYQPDAPEDRGGSGSAYRKILPTFVGMTVETRGLVGNHALGRQRASHK